MADTKISALTELAIGAVGSGDDIPIVDVSTNTTKRVDAQAALALLSTTQSGTAYTVTSGDHSTVVILSNASQVTVTIPTDASDDLIDGYFVILFSTGAGGATLSTAGITLSGSPNTTISQGEGMALIKTSTANTWLVVGGTAA